MQRNIGSEFRVALAAIVLLTLPVIFTLLLINQDEEGGGTPSISVFTSTPLEIAQQESAEVTVLVEGTPTAISTEASTPLTLTLTSTSTSTDEAVATATGLSVLGVRTPTTVEAETTDDDGNQTVIPTSSPTRRTSATPTPTTTPTPTPSRTPTRRPTATDVPTRTPSSTPTTALVRRATEDDFAGILPTPTLPASPTVGAEQVSRTPSSCMLPRSWTTYRVQPGDTLFAISLATNSTVSELRAANCIDDVDNITSEELVFVPRAPLRPVSTQVPSVVRPGLNPYGCTDPRVQITSPAVSSRVGGVFAVQGSATRDDFGYYKIEVRPDWADVYNFYLDSRTPVENDVLGLINAEIFGDGLHWVRLTVVDERAGIPPGATCEVPLIFE